MHIWLTLIIVAVTFIGIALGEFPYLRANRTTITLMGVGILLATHQVSFQQIGGFLSLDTLVLLFGMMIINANLQMAGFFRLAGAAILRFTGSPRSLLALEIAAGLLSALFPPSFHCCSGWAGSGFSSGAEAGTARMNPNEALRFGSRPGTRARGRRRLSRRRAPLEWIHQKRREVAVAAAPGPRGRRRSVRTTSICSRFSNHMTATPLQEREKRALSI